MASRTSTIAKRAVGAEVERLAGLELLVRGDLRRLDGRHEPEAALRLREPSPGPVRESDVPLVPRPLAGRELETPGDVERARALLRARVHPDLERGGRRDELGDRPDGLEVRALARDGGLALRADRDERRPGLEPDLRPRSSGIAPRVHSRWADLTVDPRRTTGSGRAGRCSPAGRVLGVEPLELGVAVQEGEIRVAAGPVRVLEAGVPGLPERVEASGFFFILQNTQATL